MIWVPYKLFDEVCEPRRATEGAAGWDLVARTDVVLPSRVPQKIPVGVALELPRGWHADVRPRSGLSTRGIWAQVGLVDDDYRGEICAILVNLTDSVLGVHRGDRVAQLVLVATESALFRKVDELTPTTRGVGGFGSTGR